MDKRCSIDAELRAANAWLLRLQQNNKTQKRHSGQSDQSLGRAKRLTEREQFLKFFKDSEVARNSFFEVYRIPNGIKIHRLGITIKATKMSSVVRMGVKRALREFFRKKIGTTIEQEDRGFDYNFVIAFKFVTKGKNIQEKKTPNKEWLLELKKELARLNFKELNFFPAQVKPK